MAAFIKLNPFESYIIKEYTYAIEKAPESESYAEEMCEDSAAKSFASHLRLTLEQLANQRIISLKNIGDKRKNLLLGVKATGKKSKKK
jgi:hypothetical protein